MPDRDVSAPYIESTQPDPLASGSDRPEDGSNAEDGYDETQRSEIAEAEGTGPTDGVLMTDMNPDMGGDIDDAEIEENRDALPSIVDTDGFDRDEA
jgi:DNA-directed RNA polymerase subunit delta